MNDFDKDGDSKVIKNESMYEVMKNIEEEKEKYLIEQLMKDEKFQKFLKDNYVLYEVEFNEFDEEDMKCKITEVWYLADKEEIEDMKDMGIKGAEIGKIIRELAEKKINEDGYIKELGNGLDLSEQSKEPV